MESTDYNFGYNAQTGEYVDSEKVEAIIAFFLAMYAPLDLNAVPLE